METWERRLGDTTWMSKKDKKLFLKFADTAQNKRRPAGTRRIEKYHSDLTTCHKITGRGIIEMTKGMKALSQTIRDINADKTYSFDTKRDIKRLAGTVHHFINSGEASLKYAQKEVKELCAHDHKASDKRLAKDTITRDEMRAMLRYGNTLDKALIALLFDSGMRMGELIQLKKSDLIPIAEGLDVLVPAGKTGERRIVVVEASSYIQHWIEEHPDKSKDGPLWISPETKRPLCPGALSRRIRLVVERMNAQRKKEGIPEFKKSINPHNFRHSRATELGGESGMTEAILCRYFGWEIGSTMPRTYLHLTDEQVKRAVLRVYGKAKKEEERVIITHWTCRKCQYDNPMANVNCGKCTTPQNSDKEIIRMAQLEAEMAEMKEQLRELITKSAKGKLREKVEKSIKSKIREEGA